MVLFYDGVCGLCNRLNRFVLDRDRHDRFRFASLQSGLAHQVLPRHGADPADLDTLYLLIDEGTAQERVLARGRAVLRILRGLGGVWAVLARVLGWLPAGLVDWIYDRVAARRYQVFGQYDACPLPSPATRHKFLDV